MPHHARLQHAVPAALATEHEGDYGCCNEGSSQNYQYKIVFMHWFTFTRSNQRVERNFYLHKTTPPPCLCQREPCRQSTQPLTRCLLSLPTFPALVFPPTNRCLHMGVRLNGHTGLDRDDLFGYSGRTRTPETYFFHFQRHREHKEKNKEFTVFIYVVHQKNKLIFCLNVLLPPALTLRTDVAIDSRLLNTISPYQLLGTT